METDGGQPGSGTASGTAEGPIDPNREIDLTPDRSGMPTAHARRIAEFCREHDVFVFVRPSERETMELIDAGFATKSMDIHDKSSNWGPMAGAVPLDRAFSKKVAEHPTPQTLVDPSAMFRRVRQVGQDGAGHSNAQTGVEKPIQLLISDKVRLQWFRQAKMTVARGWRSAIPKMYYHGVARNSEGHSILNDVTAKTLFMLEHVVVPRDVLHEWGVSEDDNEYWKVSWATLKDGGDRGELDDYSEMQPLFVWGYPIDEAKRRWPEDLFSWGHDGDTYSYPWKHYRAVTGDYDLWMVAPHMAWWKLNTQVVQFIDEHNVASSATFFVNWLNNQLNAACDRTGNPVFNHGAEEQNYGFTQALDKELVMFTSSGGARMVDMQADMPRIMVELMCSGYLTLWNKRYDEIDPQLGHKQATEEELAMIEEMRAAGVRLGELTDPTGEAGADATSEEVIEARAAFASATDRLREANVDLADVSLWNHRFRAELRRAAKQPGAHVGFEKLSRADINQRDRRYPLPKIDNELNYWTAPEDVFEIQLVLQERLVDATMGGGYSELDGLEAFFDANPEALGLLSERIRQAPGTDDMRSDAFLPNRATVLDTFEIRL
jgi:hypothetical protein